MSEPLVLPKTRSEALATGEALYLTGKPCKRNHISPRHTSSGNCVACKAELNREKGWVHLGPAKARLLNNTLTITVPQGMSVTIKHTEKEPK